ncbi:MAG: adenylosuccinate lyase [Candidatus Hydrogenedentota bacterium]|nr:MAG: adenylosuccinate lyase [Candidatus Hydrogenedentota bacterium]
MIERYSTAEMRKLWSLENKFEIWKEIEIAACEYWNQQGKISDSDMQAIREKASFDVQRILEIEAEVHHDVIAFLTNMAENIGPASRFVHFGMTSSDVVDTALSVLMRQAGKKIQEANKAYLQALYQQAVRYKDLPVAGRTHGVHAEPTTLGLKLLGYYTEALRNYHRLEQAIEEISYGKISGAVGTYSQLPPELEKYVLEKLGLKVEPVSTQVVPRDRHAVFLNAIALTGQGIARLAQEIRLLQKTESREVEEPFQKGQKGSSAMPHKRNPILCERMCGLARTLMGYQNTAMQDIPLWHERDISHSSVERVILPDATSLLEYMLIKMKFVVENLHVHPENIDRVLNLTGGLMYSSRALLVITETLGITREEAYKIVQNAAMQVWQQGGNLRNLLEQNPDLKKIPKEKWDFVFDPKSYLNHVDFIFDRVEKPPQ